MENENDFNAAVDNLSNGELIADVYYIVAGVGKNEGVVISRNRHNATDIWRIDVPNRFYVLETNYDHWKPAPWFDDRRTPALARMNALGQKGVTIDSMMKV